MGKMKLHWQVLIALGLAVISGLLLARAGAEVREPVLGFVTFFGTLFLNALKMIVVPLVAASIIAGMAGIGGADGFGRLGLKTLGFYVLTTTLAILVGLAAVDLIRPGYSGGEPIKDLIGLSDETDSKLESVKDRDLSDLSSVFLNMVPPNIFEAASKGNMLGIITFSILFGFFITRLSGASRDSQLNFWTSTNEVMLKITNLIMRFAPIGVFGLVTGVVAELGVDALRSALMFLVTVILSLGFHFFVTLPLILLLIARVNPWRHYRAMLPALLTSFSTASSAATIPVTMECLEKNSKVSNRVTSFVIPLGATVNMDGTALYECVAAMFIAQAYGIEIGFAGQFMVVLLALLTSIGVAGIPQASLVAIVLILQAVGVPMEGIGLILAVDRILDMCRTSVNIFSDSCGAVVIAKSEGETEVLAR